MVYAYRTITINLAKPLPTPTPTPFDIAPPVNAAATLIPFQDAAPIPIDPVVPGVTSTPDFTP